MIQHNKPTLPCGSDWLEVTGRLEPGWAADGPAVERFESLASEVIGQPTGVAVCSGSMALQLSLIALGIGPGVQVLVPSYCCAAVLNAVRLAGAEPVLFDCDPQGFNPCPKDAARRKTSKTGAVIVAHLFGVPAAIQPFRDSAPLIVEDCAQSFGARGASQPIGSDGDAAIASFYATKVITTGHGGLACARNPQTAARLRDLTHYDNREDWEPRFACRMPELSAALGMEQLDRLPQYIHRRRMISAYYDEALSPCGWKGNNGDDGMWFRYTLRFPDATAAIQAFAELEVGARRPVFRPLHRYFGAGDDFPGAEAAHREIVSLPIYPTLTDAQVETVAAAALKVIRRGAGCGA